MSSNGHNLTWSPNSGATVLTDNDTLVFFRCFMEGFTNGMITFVVRLLLMILHLAFIKIHVNG